MQLRLVPLDDNIIFPGMTVTVADLDDVPAEVREEMAFHPTLAIGEVLELALEPAPAGREALAA